MDSQIKIKTNSVELIKAIYDLTIKEMEQDDLVTGHIEFDKKTRKGFELLGIL